MTFCHNESSTIYLIILHFYVCQTTFTTCTESDWQIALVFCDSCNKARTHKFKTTEIFLSRYWKLEVPNQSYCPETAVLTGLHSCHRPARLCSASREESFPCLFQFLVAAIIPWLLTCSVTKSCLTLCNPMDCSTLGFPVLHCLTEFAQTHVR